MATSTGGAFFYSKLMQVEDAIAEWRRWEVGVEPSIVRVFSEGLNHITAKLQTDNEYLVLKIFQGSGQNEVAAQSWANALGLAPKFRFIDSELRYAVMDCVVDINLSQRAVSVTDLRAIGQTLRSLHTATGWPVVSTVFDPLGVCDTYLSQAGERANALHQQIKPFIEEFANDQTPWCYCHNDLVPENILVGDGRAIFIDWEYSNYHNPWFDIAGIIYYFGLSRRQIDALFEAYALVSAPQKQRRVFYSSQITLLWIDILWHLMRSGENAWPQLRTKEQDLHRLVKKIEGLKE